MKGLVSILLVAGSAAALVGMANAQPSGGGPRAILFDQPNFQGRAITIVEGAPDLDRWGFAARAMSARFEGDWTVCDAPDLDGRCATVRGDVANLTQVGLRRIVSLGEGSLDGGPSDSQTEAASAAMTDDTAPARPDVGTMAGDEAVPGARVGGQARSSDIPPPPAPPAAPTPPPPSAGPAPSAAPAAPAAPAGSSAPKVPEAPQQLALAALPAVQAPAPTTGAAPAGDAGRSAVFFAKPMRGGSQVAVDLQGPANQFCHDQGLGPAVYFDTDGQVLRDILCRRS